MNEKTILLVDDDADICAMMEAVLVRNGFTVVTALNGEEGLKKYTENMPDIIFLDLMMEKVDTGITVCKKIRETDKKAKIYLLSAVGDETARTLDMQAIGLNGAMSKPVSPDELLRLVR